MNVQVSELKHLYVVLSIPPDPLLPYFYWLDFCYA